GVANVKPAVGDDWVVPGFPLDRLETANLTVLVRVCRHEHDFTLVRDHHQQRLVAEQQNLPAAIAAVFPEPATGLQVNASEDPTVKAIDGVFMHDEIVERGLELPG